MQILGARVVLLGGLFVLILASGIWLSHLGRPYQQVIFTAHKLIALAFSIYAGMLIYQLQKPMGMSLWAISLTAAALLAILALFATGAMLSAGKPVHRAVILIHRIAPLVSAVFTAATLWLLWPKK